MMLRTVGWGENQADVRKNGSEIFIHCIYFYYFWVWHQYLLILNCLQDELESYIHVEWHFQRIFKWLLIIKNILKDLKHNPTKAFNWLLRNYLLMGRYSLLPHTTKRRTTTNLKTKTNQNCQKIKLYGSLTTKELKKKHSSRPVGGAEMGNQCGEDSQHGCHWWSEQSHIRVQINREEQPGSNTDHTTQGSSVEN